MSNKGGFILLILVLSCLASSISFALQDIAVNDYYDIETQTSSAVLNASHDFKCTAKGQAIPVNNARKMNNLTGGSSDPIEVAYNYTDVTAKVWSQGTIKFRESSPGGASRVAFIVTTEGNYSKLVSYYAENGKCQFDVQEISLTPFFGGATYPSIGYIASSESWSGDNDVYYSAYDAGFMGEDYVGATHKYVASENKLVAVNSSLTYLQSYTTDSVDNLINTNCPSSVYLDTSYSQINFGGGYEVYCINSSFTDKHAYAVWQLVYQAGSGGGSRSLWVSSDYFNLWGVTNTPLNPMPNMTVKVTWFTGQTADSKLYLRWASLGNITNMSGWTSFFDGSNVTAHSMTINGSYVIDQRLYQYYVQSNRTGTSRNSTIYNFTVGVIAIIVEPVIPSELENRTYPNLWHGVKSLTSNLGIDMQYGFFLFAFILVLIPTLASLIKTHNPALSVAIFIVGISLFSIIGFLPYYFIIIIALGFAFALVKIIRGLMGD